MKHTSCLGISGFTCPTEEWWTIKIFQMRLHPKGYGMLAWDKQNCGYLCPTFWRISVWSIIHHRHPVVTMVNNCRSLVPIVACISEALPWHEANLWWLGIVTFVNVEHIRNYRVSTWSNMINMYQPLVFLIANGISGSKASSTLSRCRASQRGDWREWIHRFGFTLP